MKTNQWKKQLDKMAQEDRALANKIHRNARRMAEEVKKS